MFQLCQVRQFRRLPGMCKGAACWLHTIVRPEYTRVMAPTRDAAVTESPDKTQLARTVFFVFLLTFMLARIVVFLIMSRRLRSRRNCPRRPRRPSAPVRSSVGPSPPAPRRARARFEEPT
jgi:hypothetical protein